MTFDDGPVPEITPWVLGELKTRGIRASFFCVGENAFRHKDVFDAVLEDGHRIGNHTMNHLNGWKTKTSDYLHNVHTFENKHTCKFFRPPYGKLKRSQGNSLKKDFEVILWDVLSGDYNQHLSGEQVLSNSLKGLQPGSIVVFHDSIKAKKNLQFALPRFLDQCQRNGFEFAVL